MTSIDPRTVDPAQPHHADNGGHEMSDFSFTSVLWLLPLSVVILIVFTLTCLAWFRGAKDRVIERKQAEFVPAELKEYRAHEDEVLNSYKILDKDKGRIQIPVARAMELIAQEHQGKGGREWVPITDTYLQGAAFTAAASPSAEEDNGIQVQNAEERRGSKPSISPKAPGGKGPKGGPASVPAQNSADDKGATRSGPGGSPHGAPGGSSQGKK